MSPFLLWALIVLVVIVVYLLTREPQDQLCEMCGALGPKCCIDCGEWYCEAHRGAHGVCARCAQW